jgi:preprotein translocase subunit SecD
MKNLGLKLTTIILVFLVSVYFSLGNFLEKSWLPTNKMTLGLDIRGGLSLLLEADLEKNYEEKLLNLEKKIKAEFNIVGKREKDGIVLAKLDQNLQDKIRAELDRTIYSFDKSKGDLQISIREDFFIKEEESIINRIIEVLHYRIDATGLQEITLQKEGRTRILIQIPGLNDNSSIKRILSQTGSLTFHLVDQTLSQEEMTGPFLTLDLQILPLLDGRGSLPVGIQPLMKGEVIADAQATTSMGKHLINFKLSNEGAKTFAKITQNNIGKALALVLDKKIIMAPTINEPIMTGSGQISGNFTAEEAKNLAILLRSGSLPVPIKIVQESLVGPSLGEESVDKGVNAVIIGALLVILIMILIYRSLGIIASLALICNLFLMIALLTLMGATLTLPGLAGMALTLGMAVDANVLIYERVKEEKGKINLEKSLNKGYDTAIRTILDSNITTILVALILYGFGSNAIRGFALTLLLGIGSSLLTAVLFTKVFINCWLYLFRPRTI